MTQPISKLEQAELECRRQDAALLKNAVASFWQAFKAGHDPEADAMERAKLACQKRDVAVARHAAAAIGHTVTGHGDDMGGAARA